MRRAPRASSRSRSRPSALDHAHLHGPERDAGRRGDLALRRVAVEAAAQDVGLLVGQPAEQAGEAPVLEQRVEAGGGIALALEQRQRARRVARLGHAAAQVVDRARAGDRHHPGQRRRPGPGRRPRPRCHASRKTCWKTSSAAARSPSVRTRKPKTVPAAARVQLVQRRRVAPAQAVGEAAVGGRDGAVGGPARGPSLRSAATHVTDCYASGRGARLRQLAAGAQPAPWRRTSP